MWKYYYLMPKNVFTLSVCALPVYTIILYTLSVAWKNVLPRRKRRVFRIWLPMLLPALTLHALPLLSLVYINNALGVRGDAGYHVDILVAYGWVASLVIAGQALVYYIPLRLIGIIPAGSKTVRLRDYATPRSRALGTVILVSAVALYTSYRIAHDALSVRQDSFSLPALSRSNVLDSYTIGLMADLQFDEFTGPERVRLLLDAVRRASPAIILIAGDFVTTDPAYLPATREALSSLRARDSVYTVLGDHDYWTGFDTTVNTIARSGVILGYNTMKYIPIGMDTLNLIMITNCLPDRIASAVLDSLLSLPRRNGPTILLVHDAKDNIVDAAAAYNVDLVAGGHTHGSQVAIDFFGLNLSELLMDSDYISRVYRRGKTVVYICNGLGMSVAPIRYNATPSFGLLRIVKR